MSKPLHEIRAGIIGAGFIGPVHIEALRRLGVRVEAICGSKSAQGIAEAWGIPQVFLDYDYEAMLRSADLDVVHITSPNRHHFLQAKAALEAGKHVVCEKPLAMDTRETAALVELAAARPRQVFAVNYNVRFYPAVLQLRADVNAGRLGKIVHVNGSYFQDWLLKDTDYNWRLLAAEGGSLRAVGDIGTHWMDTVSFILGDRIDAVFACLERLHDTRRRPAGPVQTFTSDTEGELIPYQVDTEDFAQLLLKFSGGARGNASISQVAAGRKNSIRIELYGSEGSACWESETPNHIEYGRRDTANLVAQRGCPGFTDAAGLTDYPPGHAEGFPDTFKMLYRHVYAHISRAAEGAPLYATAQDGHHEVELCDAILRSHQKQSWITL